MNISEVVNALKEHESKFTEDQRAIFLKALANAEQGGPELPSRELGYLFTMKEMFAK